MAEAQAQETFGVERAGLPGVLAVSPYVEKSIPEYEKAVKPRDVR
jgi:hypothetical protein